MAPGGRVLIIERLIPDDPREAVPVLLSDLNMLLVTGGQERTNDEYGALLAAAGLRPGQIEPVAAPYGVEWSTSPGTRRPRRLRRHAAEPTVRDASASAVATVTIPVECVQCHIY
jgi:O-methyltransferase domain